MEKIKFNLDTEEATKQLNRLIDLSYFNSEQKKLSVLYKSINLFAVKKEKCLNYFMNKYNLKYDSAVSSYAYSNSSDIFKPENFMFVYSEVNTDDLEYYDKRYLTMEEISYYLFRVTLKIVESFGSQKLNRKYFMSLSDSYLKQTNRKLNKNKIAHLNKILQKYSYIHIDSHNTFYIGKNHPLFNTTANSEECRSIVTSDSAPVVTMSEKYRLLEQDYNNLITDYKCLQKNYENIESKYNELKKQYENLENRYKNFFKPCMN